MAKKVWVEIQIEMGQSSYPYVGQVEAPIEASILDKPPEAFVKLENVRWFDNKDQSVFPSVTRQEDLEEGFAATAYFRRSHIIIVTPIREDATVWQNAK